MSAGIADTKRKLANLGAKAARDDPAGLAGALLGIGQVAGLERTPDGSPPPLDETGYVALLRGVARRIVADDAGDERA